MNQWLWDTIISPLMTEWATKQNVYVASAVVVYSILYSTTTRWILHKTETKKQEDSSEHNFREHLLQRLDHVEGQLDNMHILLNECRDGHNACELANAELRGRIAILEVQIKS